MPPPLVRRLRKPDRGETTTTGICDYDNDVITDGLATKGFSHQRLVFLPFFFPLLPKEVREGFQYGERRSGRFEQPYLP